MTDTVGDILRDRIRTAVIRIIPLDSHGNPIRGRARDFPASERLVLECRRWLPGDPPPGFPRYYRTPQLALPPAPHRRALPPGPVRWRWQ